jgi:hypothetical protein
MAKWHRNLRDRTWLKSFARVPNWRKHIMADDVRMAGYPEAKHEHGDWRRLHDLCKATFVNGKGRTTYIWFGSTFFFLTEEDANLFRTLQYLA